MNENASVLPRAAAPFHDFSRLLARSGFAISPEQTVSFMRAVAMLGPRSMQDIRQAALATLAPHHDQRAEFEALFRAFFHGDADSVIAMDEDEEETKVKDDAGPREQQVETRRDEQGGELSTGTERLATRDFDAGGDLGDFRRALPAMLPTRRSLRWVRAPSRGTPDLRRSLREIVRADGDVPWPLLRRRQPVPRRIVILIDVSGSMKRHTEDHLRLAHAVVRAATHVEVFAFGTRLTRLTLALRARDRGMALHRAAALVEDWDGGTRIGPALLAFLSVPRFSAFARGAAVLILSDGLERGDHAEMTMALRRLAGRAFRLSLATPLAGDPRFRPETAALRAALPFLDDLVDGSSLDGLIRFILSLATPAPRAEQVWRKAS